MTEATNESENMSITFDSPRQNAVKLGLIALALLAGYPLIMIWLQQHDIVLALACVTGGMIMACFALVEATRKVTISVSEDRLTIIRSHLICADQDEFDSIDDISLSQQIRGHGNQPLDVQKVRREYDELNATPRLNGLFISSHGRVNHIAMRLPFESLLSIAETLREYAQARGIMGAKRKD